MKIENIFPISVFLVAMLACGALGVPTSEPIAPPILTQPIPTNALTFTAIPTFTSVATDISPAPLLSQAVTMRSSPFDESGSAPVYTITAQIPSLQGFDDPRVSTFNARLRQIAQDQIDQFRNDVLSFASNLPFQRAVSLTCNIRSSVSAAMSGVLNLTCLSIPMARRILRITALH